VLMVPKVAMALTLILETGSPNSFYASTMPTFTTNAA